jgi:hypothetical protein
MYHSVDKNTKEAFMGGGQELIKGFYDRMSYVWWKHQLMAMERGKPTQKKTTKSDQP